MKDDFKQMPGNEYYSESEDRIVEENFKQKKVDKFAKKYLIWQAICSCGEPKAARKRESSYNMQFDDELPAELLEVTEVNEEVVEIEPQQDNFDIGEQFDPDDAPIVIAVVKAFFQGFTVDDGELRPYEDPNNFEFNASVGESEIPDELWERGVRKVTYEDYRHLSYYANDETGPPQDSFDVVEQFKADDAHGELRVRGHLEVRRILERMTSEAIIALLRDSRCSTSFLAWFGNNPLLSSRAGLVCGEQHRLCDQRLQPSKLSRAEKHRTLLDKTQSSRQEEIVGRHKFDFF